MRVVLVEPGKPAISKELPNRLEVLQQEVGGWIEAVYLADDDACMIVNEEGKLLGMKPNILMKNGDGSVYDVLCGNVLIVGVDEDDFCGLTDDQTTRYLEEYSTADRLY